MPLIHRPGVAYAYSATQNHTEYQTRILPRGYRRGNPETPPTMLNKAKCQINTDSLLKCDKLLGFRFFFQLTYRLLIGTLRKVHLPSSYTLIY